MILGYQPAWGAGIVALLGAVGSYVVSTEIQRLLERLTTTEKRLREAKAETTALTAQPVVAAAEHDRLKEDLAARRDELDRLRREVDRLPGLQQEIDALRRERDDLLRQTVRLGALSERVAELETSLARAEAKLLEGVSTKDGIIPSFLAELVSQVNEASTGIDENLHSMAAIDQRLKGISDSVELLASNAEESSSSILEMAAANDEVAESMFNLAASVQQTATSIEEMAFSVREVANNIEALSGTAEETSSAMNE